MGEPALIIYDGDCVFCQSYVRLVRLRKTIGKVEVLNARFRAPRIARYWGQGYDLNEGVLFAYNGQVYCGAEAVNVMARLSSPVSTFNKINRAVFAGKATSRRLYPLLKLGRRVTLLMRGKGLMKPPGD